MVDNSDQFHGDVTIANYLICCIYCGRVWELHRIARQENNYLDHIQRAFTSVVQEQIQSINCRQSFVMVARLIENNGENKLKNNYCLIRPVSSRNIVRLFLVLNIPFFGLLDHVCHAAVGFPYDWLSQRR